MNKPVHLGLLILEIRKTIMYNFWYDYVEPKYQYNAKLCYTATGSFIIYIKTKHVYNHIANDVEKRFYTSNYEIERPLPRDKNKKVIGFMKDKLCGKIMIEYVALRPKTNSYLIDDGINDKKAKRTEKCVIKRILKFNYYKNSLLNHIKIIAKT